MIFRISTAAALLLASAGIVHAEAHGGAVVSTADVGGETVFVDANSMTLYTFDNDAPGVSNCYDQCAVNWPPVVTDAGMELPEGFTLVERNDGAMQVAYDGMPLYLWVGDTAPGDMTGDGVGGVWHVAKP